MRANRREEEAVKKPILPMQKPFSGLVYTAWLIIRAEMVVILVVVVSRLVLGWHHTRDIVEAFIAAAVLILAGSSAAMVAGGDSSRRMEHFYVKTAMHTLSDEERIRQFKAERSQSEHLLLQGLLLAGLTLGIGFGIEMLFG